MKTLVWIFSVYNQLSGFSREYGEVMQMFQHFVKPFLDQLQERCGSTENPPLLFLFSSSWFALCLSGSHHIHPTHCLLYFMHMSCWVCTPIFAMHTACHKEPPCLQVICNTHLILSFSYSENCLRFMFSLCCFCLLVVLLPQVRCGWVLDIQVPEMQCSLFSVKCCCKKLLPSLIPSTNESNLLMSLLAGFIPYPFLFLKE